MPGGNRIPGKNGASLGHAVTVLKEKKDEPIPLVGSDPSGSGHDPDSPCLQPVDSVAQELVGLRPELNLTAFGGKDNENESLDIGDAWTSALSGKR